MEKWKEYKFSEIADFPPKIKMEKGEEYPFVLMDEVDAGFKYVRASFTKKYNGSGAKFENGDTLFARITPSLENGKIAQIKDIDKPAFGSTEFFVFRGKKDVSDSDFIYYLSKTDWFRQNAINSFVGASGRQRADTKFVGKTKLTVPLLPTQRKIANILSAYDDLIENNLKRIKLLEEMAQKTYEEWFIRFKFPGHETVVFDEETRLPEGWARTQIGNLVDFQNGYAFKSSIYTKGAKYKIVTIRNVQDGMFIPKVTDTISKKPTNLKDYHLLNTGDIIMSLTGNIGRICLVYGNDYLLNQRVAKLKPRKEIYQSFVYCHFRNKYTLKVLENISNGAAQQNLSPVNASKQRFVVATDECLTKFNRIVKPFIVTISTLNLQNQNLKEARDILLPRLMAGMIDVEKLELKL